MGKNVLIVKNKSHEGPGLIASVLEEEGVPYEVVDLDRGEAFPSPRAFDAVVVLGGPDSANDRTEKMRQQRERVREILNAGIPFLGICLGLQVLVKAAGGEVIRCPAREIGFRDPEGNFFQVRLTEAGRRDPLLSGTKTPFEVFHLHGETVVLTDTMTLLGAGTLCPNQMVRVGERAYGFQAHLELTPEMLGVFCRKDPDLLRMSPGALQEDFQKIRPAYTQRGRLLFNAFFRMSVLERKR